MNFIEVCKQLGVAYAEQGHEHCRPGWVQIDCPFCNMFGHFRLGFNTRGGYGNCWLCGRVNISYALSRLTNAPLAELKKLLEDLDYDKTQYIRPTGTYDPPLGRTKYFHPAHRKYIKGRGFNVQELIRLWNIESIAMDGGKFKWRIFIPIHYQGKAVSWTTRSIVDEHRLRYISASPEREAIFHKELLYGEDYARHAIVVVEGPTDVWRVGPGAVCTFGTGYRNAQIRRMATYPVRVVCFDSATDAQARAAGLCDRLEIFDGETYRVELKAKDPGSASEKEINQLRKRFLE